MYCKSLVKNCESCVWLLKKKDVYNLVYVAVKCGEVLLSIVCTRLQIVVM